MADQRTYTGGRFSLEVNGANVAPDAYVKFLTDKLAARSDKVVFVVADDAAPYPKLVAALDGARTAGATTLGMAPDAPTAN